ncbi:MAG: polyprenyl synthetase family protein [Jatrophihabitans sp.]|uniref:polyprenyl synthetase family protein n=1 Tax=Jatrophihabitans sp. TaxID=1932789 RepID=UPI003F804AFE
MTSTLSHHTPAPIGRPARATSWRAVTGEQRSAVLARIDEVLLSLGGPLVRPARRLTHASSKMVRPGLSLAVAGLVGDPTPEAYRAAAAVELLHCATLVHDDIIDRADERRGRPTVAVEDGDATAIVTGDFLIAAANTAALGLGPFALAELIATLAQLCAGQAREDEHRFDMTTTVLDALEIANDKTGSLLRAAAVLGAMAAHLPDGVIEALGEFGAEFGIALQVVDDVLDLASTTELLGKPAGADVRAGVIGVPTAIALERVPELTTLITPAATKDDTDRAVALILDCGAVADAVVIARRHAARAEAAVDAAGLATIADFADWPRRYVETLLATRVAPHLRVRLGITVADAEVVG